jgi:hypothetical protein
MRALILVVLASLILLPACRAIPKQAEEDLAKPVNCATAEQDIATLKSEKASVEKRMAEGVTAVVPAGAVLSILTLQEKDKIEVATGIYNSKLEEKINEIQITCGLE